MTDVSSRSRCWDHSALYWLAEEVRGEYARRALAGLTGGGKASVLNVLNWECCRQGEMARWVSGTGKWVDCHFVLTRMGFLHWLNHPEDPVPADGLNLARCHFEQVPNLPSFYISLFLHPTESMHLCSQKGFKGGWLVRGSRAITPQKWGFTLTWAAPTRELCPVTVVKKEATDAFG